MMHSPNQPLKRVLLRLTALLTKVCLVGGVLAIFYLVLAISSQNNQPPERQAMPAISLDCMSSFHLQRLCNLSWGGDITPQEKTESLLLKRF